jgi:hypothetical protein
MAWNIRTSLPGCRCAGPTKPAFRSAGTTTERASGSPSTTGWAGWFGNAQIGPIYLGGLGTVSLIFGFIWFEIIGFNMLASVNWDAIRVHPPAVLAGAGAAAPNTG